MTPMQRVKDTELHLVLTIEITTTETLQVLE